MNDLFTYGTEVRPTQLTLDGFSVDATDGHIGSVDEATYDVGDSYIVVDTGFWIFGKRRLIPGSAIHEIDLEEETIALSMTKAQVKEAPDYDAQVYTADESYRATMAAYYHNLWPY